MIKHVLLCACTALPLLAFCVGCSGDMVSMKARPAAETQPIGTAVPVDSLTTANQEKFAALLHDGQMLFRQQQYAEAVSSLREAVALEPNHWQPYYFLGQIKTQTEEFNVADALLSTSLKLAPSDPRLRSQIYVALGENCEAQALYGRAAQLYRTALNLHPDAEVARQGLARLDEQHRLSDR